MREALTNYNACILTLTGGTCMACQSKRTLAEKTCSMVAPEHVPAA